MNNSGIRSQLQLVIACRDVACRVPTVVIGMPCGYVFAACCGNRTLNYWIIELFCDFPTPARHCSSSPYLSALLQAGGQNRVTVGSDGLCLSASGVAIVTL